ncbi:MAG: hypothetical protein QUS33_05795 [Dehalococcoidia bacterium]|nr:hypothetical protein [Dehalococcoidia bacterium]
MVVRIAPLLAVLGLLIVPLCFGCGALGLEESDVPHTENYSQVTTVTLQNDDLNGNVSIEAWGKDYVELTWTRRTAWGKAEFEKAKVEVTQSGGKLDIEGKLLSKDAKVSIDYEILLPRNVILAEVTSGDGNIKITGTSGDTIITAGLASVSVRNTFGHIDMTLERGKIRLEGTTGGANLTTTEDSIEVVSVDGDVTATNSNGAISITNCRGNATLKTSGGGIQVDNLEGIVLLASTKGAPITIKRATAVEVVETSDDDITVEIASVGVKGTIVKVDRGSIRLYLSSSVNADMELKAVSGAVAVNSSAGNIVVTGEFSPQHFKGTVGTGGNSIYAETSKGRIDVYGMSLG